MTCKETGCEKKAKARGWCAMHYQRWAKHGDPSVVITVKKDTRPCVVPGCQKPRHAREMCSAHATLWARHGRLSRKTIKNTGATCKQPSCEEAAYCQGRCRRHYEQALTYGEAVMARDTGLCHACGTDGPLVVDHDHACCPAATASRQRHCGDCSRGFLCSPCNVAIGMVRESVDRLRSLANYLERVHGHQASREG